MALLKDLIVNGASRFIGKLIAKDIEATTVKATTFTGALSGNASSATKVGSATVGSATKGVYLNGGTPTAMTYELGMSVPAGSKLTDTVYTHPTTTGNKHIPSGGSSGQFLKWSADGTAVWAADNNTWRGIQNNLTSTATDQSLSANQGRVLKSLIDAIDVKAGTGSGFSVQLSSTGWTASGSDFKQTVAVAGMTADFVPSEPDLVAGSSINTAESAKQFVYIKEIESTDGNLVFTASAKPTVNIEIAMQVYKMQSSVVAEMAYIDGGTATVSGSVLQF